MAITSQVSAYLRLGEVIVDNWKDAGLLKASTIKPILTTIEKSLVIRTLGTTRTPRPLRPQEGFGNDS